MVFMGHCIIAGAGAAIIVGNTLAISELIGFNRPLVVFLISYGVFGLLSGIGLYASAKLFLNHFVDINMDILLSIRRLLINFWNNHISHIRENSASKMYFRIKVKRDDLRAARKKN